MKLRKRKAKVSSLILLPIIVVALLACAGLNKSNSNVSDVEDLLKAMDAAYTSRDFEKILTLYTEDCYFEAPGGIRLYGKAALEENLRASINSFPDLKMTPKSYVISGNRVAGEFAVTGTHTGSTAKLSATGRYVSVPIASFIEIEEGRIKNHTLYYDMVTMLKQLGIKRLR